MAQAMNTMPLWVSFPSFPLFGDITLVPLYYHIEYKCGQVVFDLEERSGGPPAMLLPSEFLIFLLLMSDITVRYA